MKPQLEENPFVTKRVREKKLIEVYREEKQMHMLEFKAAMNEGKH